MNGPSAPSCTARVVNDARSLPALGSLMPMHHTRSPRMAGAGLVDRIDRPRLVARCLGEGPPPFEQLHDTAHHLHDLAADAIAQVGRQPGRDRGHVVWSEAVELTLLGGHRVTGEPFGEARAGDRCDAVHPHPRPLELTGE